MDVQTIYKRVKHTRKVKRGGANRDPDPDVIILENYAIARPLRRPLTEEEKEVFRKYYYSADGKIPDELL